MKKADDDMVTFELHQVLELMEQLDLVTTILGTGVGILVGAVVLAL